MARTPSAETRLRTATRVIRELRESQASLTRERDMYRRVAGESAREAAEWKARSDLLRRFAAFRESCVAEALESAGDRVNATIHASKIKQLEAKLAESEAARLKAEADAQWRKEENENNVLAYSEQVKGLEARLRELTDAATSMERAASALRVYGGDTDDGVYAVDVEVTIANFRRIRDAQPPASPEPEATGCEWGSTESVYKRCSDTEGDFRCPACRARDIQKKPEPEASPRACAEFHPKVWLPELCSCAVFWPGQGHPIDCPTQRKCTVCGLPWSQHGGRDGE